jgi:hypothetical protein
VEQPEATATLDPEVMAVAQAQAEKDLELLAALQARKEEGLEEQEPFTITTDEPVRVPLNRAERRAQVKLYAAILASTERQTPIVNPTIIPRRERRRKKGGSK